MECLECELKRKKKVQNCADLRHKQMIYKNHETIFNCVANGSGVIKMSNDSIICNFFFHRKDLQLWDFKKRRFANHFWSAMVPKIHRSAQTEVTLSRINQTKKKKKKKEREKKPKRNTLNCYSCRMWQRMYNAIDKYMNKWKCNG